MDVPDSMADEICKKQRAAWARRGMIGSFRIAKRTSDEEGQGKGEAMEEQDFDRKQMVSVRLVDVPQARHALTEAGRLLEKLAPEDPDAREWLRKLPAVMEGLPQRYNVGDLVEYDMDGETIPGVIVANVVCHEQYVVGKGDDRKKIEGSMWMMHADRLRPRQQQAK